MKIAIPILFLVMAGFFANQFRQNREIANMRIQLKELGKFQQTRLILKSVRDATNSVCGVYYCGDVTGGANQIDIRHDGTSVFYIAIQNGTELPQVTTTWHFSGDSLLLGARQFKMEDTDLIDPQGRRWLHIR
jgi:hypothetical protein